MDDHPLPTRLEISPSGGLQLDERQALDHFHGKTRAEAAALFREKAHVHLEDLMWMGPRAFAYYVAATLPWLRSMDGGADDVECESLLGTVRQQLDEFGPELAVGRAALLRVLEAIERLVPGLDAKPNVQSRILRRCRELRARVRLL